MRSGNCMNTLWVTSISNQRSGWDKSLSFYQLRVGVLLIKFVGNEENNHYCINRHDIQRWPLVTKVIQEVSSCGWTNKSTNRTGWKEESRHHSIRRHLIRIPSDFDVVIEAIDEGTDQFGWQSQPNDQHRCDNDPKFTVIVLTKSLHESQVTQINVRQIMNDWEEKEEMSGGHHPLTYYSATYGSNGIKGMGPTNSDPEKTRTQPIKHNVFSLNWKREKRMREITISMNQLLSTRGHQELHHHQWYQTRFLRHQYLSRVSDAIRSSLTMGQMQWCINTFPC